MLRFHSTLLQSFCMATSIMLILHTPGTTADFREKPSMSLISLLAIYSLIKQAPNGGKTTDSASGNDQSSKDSSKPPVSSHFSGAGAVGGGSATGGSGGADGGGHNNPPPTGQGDAPLTAWTEEEMAALMQAVLNGNLQVISELLRQGKWDAGHFLAFIR